MSIFKADISHRRLISNNHFSHFLDARFPGRMVEWVRSASRHLKMACTTDSNGMVFSKVLKCVCISTDTRHFGCILVLIYVYVRLLLLAAPSLICARPCNWIVMRMPCPKVAACIFKMHRCISMGSSLAADNIHWMNYMLGLENIFKTRLTRLAFI